LETGNVRYEESSALNLEEDCLVLPTVADRLDESDFNNNIYEAAGESVRRSFRNDLPLRIGNVSVTGGGKLDVDRVVHVPVQTVPGAPTTAENLQVGLRSGLVTADEQGTNTVLIARPIPGDHIEEFGIDSFVETLHQDLTQYPPAHFERIILCGTNTLWKNCVKQKFDSHN